MTSKLPRYLASLFLILGFALPSVFPEVANTGYLIVTGLCLLLFARENWRPVLGNPTVWMPLLGGLALSAAFTLSARSPSDILYVAFFAPLFLVGPATVLLLRAPRVVSIEAVSLLALVATVASLSIAYYDANVLGEARAGATVNNPIHFAAVTVSLGFIALVGIYSRFAWLRVLCLGGPAVGFGAAWLSRSRGPLIAVPLMLLLSACLLAFRILPRRSAWLATLAICAAAAGGLIYVWFFADLNTVPALGEVVSLIRDGAIRDSSVGARLLMYEGGFRAWLASPLFGHGLAHFVAAAVQYGPAGVPVYEHLHSDVVDFAAAGGLIGLAAYLAFLLGGPVGVIFKPVVSPKMRAARWLMIVMPAGYLVMGLTNAMFGILTQTVLYAVTMALAVTWSSDDAA